MSEQTKALVAAGWQMAGPFWRRPGDGPNGRKWRTADAYRQLSVEEPKPKAKAKATAKRTTKKPADTADES